MGSPTFGGNPLCCAAALATIKYMIEHNVPAECGRKGNILKAGLESLHQKYPEIIQEVRGVGLMLAVEFHDTKYGYQVSKGMFKRRVLTAGTLVNAKTIRFEPSVMITEEDIKSVIEKMDLALECTKRVFNL